MSNEERVAIWGIDPEYIMALAKKGFAHPRKLLASNLGIKGEQLEKLGISAKIRAEDLSPDQWRDLTLALSQAEK
jgi:16S rRNA A1518/A1519 N6-dimethyltransferase RsmA/KsgA/DIM1 with predicted DNA glycosylase/AP lyase activity